jgi:alkylation response protein AidB-like acyl-CoA dehydrogenase
MAALGVTEPGGSDVAAMRTTARKDGGDYVINGAKTYITNGSFADFITLAVRTGDEGHGGVSLVLFPTNTPGFTWAASSTSSARARWTPASCTSTTAASRSGTCSARRTRASTTS